MYILFYKNFHNSGFHLNIFYFLSRTAEFRLLHQKIIFLIFKTKDFITFTGKNFQVLIFFKGRLRAEIKTLITNFTVINLHLLQNQHFFCSTIIILYSCSDWFWLEHLWNSLFLEGVDKWKQTLVITWWHDKAVCTLYCWEFEELQHKKCLNLFWYLEVPELQISAKVRNWLWLADWFPVVQNWNCWIN